MNEDVFVSCRIEIIKYKLGICRLQHSLQTLVDIAFISINDTVPKYCTDLN